MAHWTEFPPGYWDDRRRRDFYVDDDGEVRLDMRSETGRKLATKLIARCDAIAAEIGTPESKERAAQYRSLTMRQSGFH